MKVVVVTARGLQAGALAAYGNPWIDTPALDALAASGVVFDQHFADAADPAGARAAWRTGRFRLPASGASARSEGPNQGVDTSRPPSDLLAALREQRVFTVLIVDQSRPPPPDFEAGWDEVAYAEADEEGSALEVALDIVRATLDELAERDQWLLWIDLATPLPPWEVPAEFLAPYFQDEPLEEADDAAEDEEDADDATEEPEEDEENADDATEEPEDDDENADDATEEPEEEPAPLMPLLDPVAGPIDPADDVLFLRIQSTYAAAISYLDDSVGELLGVLDEAGVAEEALIVFTADVGQALGEHGAVGPVGAGPYEEFVHLPLILRLPRTAEAGRRVAGFTQAVDLAPTVAEAFGVILHDIEGRNLWPLMRGQVENVRASAIAACQLSDAPAYSVRTAEWALILRPGEPSQLFVKPDDRWEVNDVRQHYLEVAEELEKAVHEFVNATIPPKHQLNDGKVSGNG